MRMRRSHRTPVRGSRFEQRCGRSSPKVEGRRERHTLRQDGSVIVQGRTGSVRGVVVQASDTCGKQAPRHIS